MEKWVRTKYYFGKIIDIDDKGNIKIEHLNGTNIIQHDNIGISKSTPQRLLQKNDLVVIDNHWEEPLFVDHIDFFNDARAIVRTSSGSETINLSNKTITKKHKL